MNSSSLTAQQAEVLRDGVGRMLGYVGRIMMRMQIQAWPRDDRMQSSTSEFSLRLAPDGELVEFVSNETQFNQFNLNLNGATEYTAHHSFKYVSPGKRENYRLDVEVHVTVNANGEITAEFERVYIDCYVQCCGGEVVE